MSSEIINKQYNNNMVLRTCFLLLVAVVCSSYATSSHHHRSRHHHHDEQDEKFPYKPNPNYICPESDEDMEYFHEKALTKCKCPKIYAPVCGSDGITYHNRCFIECANREKYKGFTGGKRLTVTKMEACEGDH